MLVITALLLSGELWESRLNRRGSILMAVEPAEAVPVCLLSGGVGLCERQGKGPLACTRNAHQVWSAQVCFYCYVFLGIEYIATVTCLRVAVNNQK